MLSTCKVHNFVIWCLWNLIQSSNWSLYHVISINTLVLHSMLLDWYRIVVLILLGLIKARQRTNFCLRCPNILNQSPIVHYEVNSTKLGSKFIIDTTIISELLGQRVCVTNVGIICGHKHHVQNDLSVICVQKYEVNSWAKKQN